MKSLSMLGRKIVRPFVPELVIARYRLWQRSRAARSNVDVFVDTKAEARRWLSLTPDTYRAFVGRPMRIAAPDLVTLGVQDSSLSVLVGFEGIDAAVAAEATIERHRYHVSEPRIVPVSIVAPRDVFDEIGGVKENRDDLVRAFRRLKDAGRHIGLVPTKTHQSNMGAPRSDDHSYVVVLAAVPMHDVGGGSRAAQLALEMLSVGFHVTFVHLFPSDEDVDLGLRFIHPNLEQYSVDSLPGPDALDRGSGGMVLVEVPAEAFMVTTLALRDRGWRVVYDIIDRWSDPSLGGAWFDPTVEQRFVDVAHSVVASAGDLVEHAHAMGARAALVPNGVNADIFGAPVPEVPADMPQGRIIGYHGSLYGDWFDWDALEAVAKRFPDDTIFVIGDSSNAVPMPRNVVFAGLKPQGDLPGYLHRFAVGIVPFKLSDLTHAVSPLKVYEYLACGVPVAAPPMRALRGIEGVYVDQDLVAAVDHAIVAPRPDRGAALEQHSWRGRLVSLVGAVGIDLPSGSGVAVETVQRAPTHYSRSERRIRTL